MSRLGRLFTAARSGRLRVWLLALWLLFKHAETPRAVRWVAVAVIAYAVSPIDLIPDFIPVLGMLDDLILLPLGIALVVKLTPAPLWQACLRQAEAGAGQLPRLWWGAAAIVIVWLLVLGLFVAWLWQHLGSAL